MPSQPLLRACYVVLHIGTGPSGVGGTSDPPRAVSDASRLFALNDEIRIERLEEQLAKNVQRACDPAHYKIANDVWDRHLYAFVRPVSRVEKSKYEGMRELFAAVALSRLIHPTSTGGRYCTKVFQWGMADSAIQAIQWSGVSPDVFVGKNPRDWLSVQDAEELRRLMPWVSEDKRMYGRIHRAYWYHEYAMRSYFLDARWTLVVSALEALVSVGDKQLSEQFRGRLGQIAADFKIQVTDKELRDAYRLRSKLSHAESFLFDLETILPKQQQHELYDKMESLLRAILRRSLLDENFGSFFRDDSTVKARWPL